MLNQSVETKRQSGTHRFTGLANCFLCILHASSSGSLPFCTMLVFRIRLFKELKLLVITNDEKKKKKKKIQPCCLGVVV